MTIRNIRRHTAAWRVEGARIMAGDRIVATFDDEADASAMAAVLRGYAGQARSLRIALGVIVVGAVLWVAL